MDDQVVLINRHLHVFNGVAGKTADLLLCLLTVLPKMEPDPTDDQIKSVMPWSFSLPPDI